ncbi:hypothetical protein WJX84_009614 [Apatococcus fuscideae]|uniref:RRM domain-containing protein n=1 Tax=Apatococcus fuscideae TaxID=2026836 RepID=A0AAW1RY62_9CHLO
MLPFGPRPWGEEGDGMVDDLEEAPRSVSAPRMRSSGQAGADARPAAAQPRTSRTRLEGPSRGVFASAMRQVAPAADPGLPVDPGATQWEHPFPQPGAFLGGPTRTALLRLWRRARSWQATSSTTPPSAIQGQAGQLSGAARAVRQELDDEDLGDVLTEEDEGQQQARSLATQKRPLPASEGTPEELEGNEETAPLNGIGTTPAVLIAHFSGCGPIKRATVVKNQATGQPSGLAHVEFETPGAAAMALSLSGSQLLHRPSL